jgi:DNA-directed RNA polymerase subunit beta'
MRGDSYVANVDDNGIEREKYPIVYGAQILVKDGQKVKPGAILAEWDPYARPFLTEISGRIKFGDIIEHVTMEDQTDERTGLSTKVIIPSKRADLQPRISIKDGQGKTIKIPGSDNFARYYLPIGAHLIVQEGQEVGSGDVIAKIPRETAKTKDITGGLPRVVELFEARRPKEAAVISEIDGVIEFGQEQKGKLAVVVKPSVGEPKTYLIPKGKAFAVHKGDYVKAGDKLTEGSPNPHDILRVKKEKEVGKFLVDQIQQVYKLQGVRINDKHIEVITRQMLKRVKIVEPGETIFLVGDIVEKLLFNSVNEEVIKKGGKPATAEPSLIGITKASLITDSFISSASFQETTRALTEAAVYGKTDYLRGLKENVIVGRLIPAGTGTETYRDVGIEVPEEAEETAKAEG